MLLTLDSYASFTAQGRFPAVLQVTAWPAHKVRTRVGERR